MAGVQTFDKFIAVGLILVVAVLIDQFFPELITRRTRRWATCWRSGTSPSGSAASWP